MTYDVAVLGGGVAGAAAAHALRDLKVALIESEPAIGGRTYSERYGDHLWANYGAGYFSADKTTIIGLGDEVGVTFTRFDDRALTGDYLPEGLDKDDIAGIRQVKRRIVDEQGRRRDPAAPELDAVSFADWLGDVRPNVRAYFEAWCATMSGPASEVSLYGVLLMSGANRTAAFSDEPVAYDARGNLVVVGGNGLIAQKLAAASGADVRLGARVVSVQARDGLYVIQDERAGTRQTITAEAVVCALPAPVTAEVIRDLPAWKTDALSRITYGRITGIPLVVGPAGGSQPRFRPTADYRPDAIYCETGFLLRSPTNLEADGAYFVCQVYDRASRVIWDDSDASIQAGAFAAFQARFPDLSERVIHIGVRRWLHGLPQYTLGRMAATPALVAPVDGVSFCGDYTDITHTDGAAKSGLRAAGQARRRLGR